MRNKLWGENGLFRTKRRRVTAGIVTISALVLLAVPLAQAAPRGPAMKATRVSAQMVVLQGANFAPSTQYPVELIMNGCDGSGTIATSRTGSFRKRFEVDDTCKGAAKIAVRVGTRTLVANTSFGTPVTRRAKGTTPTTGVVSLPTQNTGAPDIDFKVDKLAEGLDRPWDSALLPDGGILIPERSGKLKIVKGGQTTQVRAQLDDVLALNESGLLGLALYPDFAQTRMFVTCLTHKEGDKGVDNRLVQWKLSADGSSAQRITKPLLTGLPVGDIGRHSGCRPSFGPDGMLYVGTGDAQRGDTPQDRTSLGGKVLRIDPKTGGPAVGNPFIKATNPRERLVYTYGQRNVQGVATEPGSTRIWSSEHGPSKDDEVTMLRPGGNGGWDPNSGGYDEGVPMTDSAKFSGAMTSWQTGEPTQEPSGIAFLGPKWGADARVLAVSMQKAQKLVLLRTENGKVTADASPAALDGKFGRIRSVRSERDGALYVTTDNGGSDVLLRLTRASAGGGGAAN